MPKRSKQKPSSPGDSDIALLAWLASCISILTFLFYFKEGDVLLYGDAVAHINIARRVFDCKTPGLLQLGTVWLPLPHLLMIPFLVSLRMWQTGAGGSIPSMIAYVFGVVGIFRLTRGALSGSNPPDGVARTCGWIAAIMYAANPNLMYVQSTAMGEAIYLAFFIWAVAYLSEWLRGNPAALTRCALCLAGACLTRYDGWFLSAVLLAVVLARILMERASSAKIKIEAAENKTGGAPLLAAVARSGKIGKRNLKQETTVTGRTRRDVVRFVLITAAAPALWLPYNAV